jgi:hypothetical protein
MLTKQKPIFRISQRPLSSKTQIEKPTLFSTPNQLKQGREREKSLPFRDRERDESSRMRVRDRDRD